MNAHQPSDYENRKDKSASIPDEFPEQVTVDFRVRYAECDAFGYLHHAKYFEYFEQARTELLRKQGVRYRDLERQGIFFVVYALRCKYLLPLGYDDLAQVTVSVHRTTHTRVDHLYTVHHEGRLTCEASSTLACVDKEGHPQAMPETLWTPSEPRNRRQSNDT